MRFGEILGHATQIAVLRRAVAQDRLHHAYLLAGTPGVGKRLVGLALAAAVNCVRPEEGEACGDCSPCRKLANGNYPDFTEILPLTPEEEKAEVPAREIERDAPDRRNTAIRIRAVRQMQSRARFAPHEGRRRVFLIDDADLMTEEAAGAMLKILEEPRPRTMFILVSASPQALLPTILSRCQSIHFGPLPTEVVAREVARRRGLDDRAAGLVASFAGGSLGRALGMDPEFFLGARRQILEELAQLEGQGSAASLRFAEMLLGLDLDLADVLLLLRSFFRDVLVWQGTGATARLLHGDLAEVVAGAATRMRPQHVRARLAAVARVERQQRNNQNRQYALEALALELADATLLAG